MDYDKWVSIGERMGLKDAELRDFVEKEKREYIDREERAQKRELLRREHENEQVKHKQVEEERKHAFELDKIKIEAGIKKDEQQREIEILRLRAETGTQASTDTNTKSLRPKLPKFEEAKDDMDAYIERFERFATTQKWDKSTWAVSLSSLLTGKGLDVYTAMPVEQASDYDALKKAVLKRYQLTEEGYRNKFRDCRQLQGETVFQFVARLKRYATRWTEMAETESTFDALMDLMLRDQFIQTCSQDLALFLKERTPKSLDETRRLAEQYIEAHGGSISGRREHKRQVPQVFKGATPLKMPVKQPQSYISREEKVCFICNRKGHIARECKANEDKKKFSGAAMGYSYRGGNRDKDYRNRETENRETPMNWRDRRDADKKKSDKQVAGSCISLQVNSSIDDECIDDGQLKLANGKSIPIISGGCTIEMVEGERQLDLRKGFVGKREVKVLRDTGCELAAVRRELVKPEQMTDKSYVMITIDGQTRIVPAAVIEVDTPYYTGELEVMVLKTLICDLVLGNMPCISDIPDENWNSETIAAAVVTRAQAEKEKRPMKPLLVPDQCDDEINVQKLMQAQKEDQALNKLWNLAQSGEEYTKKGGKKWKYFVKKDVLYRQFEQTKGTKVTEVRQIVVPTKYRRRVMSLGHESIVGGHMSSQKTSDRILSNFYWPGIMSDVARFCRSCDICQKTTKKGKVTKVPLGEMPIIDTPFHRVAVDLIGPIAPVSEKGNRYILTVVDYATRYPEAVALPKIETERIAEALLDVFSRVGFPSEILSDRGTQFTSDLMKEVSRLVSVRQLFTTPYNPKCNGLCERLNGTLKSMIKKMCQERPKDWDRYLSAVLFAYREVPQASTGFSPFELLFGRTVRGPMQILKELWTEKDVSETRNAYEYVLDLRERLEETCKIARESLREAQGSYKHHYDKRAKRRNLKVGDKVLVLLPTDQNKLLLQWKGPFEVVEVLSGMNYRVQTGNRISTFHINLLKKYEERETIVSASTAVVDVEDHDEVGVVNEEVLLDLVNTSQGETWRDVQISDELSEEQKNQVKDLLQEFSSIFSDKPGDTSLEEHKIELTTQEPIRVKQYPIPYAKTQDVEEEVKKMLDVGVIEKTNSQYNSPVVLVKKKDNSTRFCIDFRRLNAVTKFDTEPMSNVEDILTKLSEDKYFTKIDLAKGYWQIPVEEKSRHITAFTTQSGAYQFRKMPFGMINSGATFNRMMRKLLQGSIDADHYVDDILGHTVTWNQHLAMLRELFTRIKEAGLTVRPTKCMIGYRNVGFTGHVVGNGVLQMEEDKVVKIREAERPKTKSQVRAFLGLAGYYRKFIPSFAETAAPLSDLVKKGSPNNVIWDSPQEDAFTTLKKKLTQTPILRLPDFSRQFLLQTDASDSGVGAALLQEFDDGVFPIAYASKKLLTREKNYSVIERECLAMVFGIKKFQKYLYGKEFTLQIDHAPLTYIQRCKVNNGRVMRWALFLQNYKFRVEAMKGSDNVCADYLSRQ